jgi:hypothetical protein
MVRGSMYDRFSRCLGLFWLVAAEVWQFPLG